jgi:hypothetical protein
MISKPGRGMKQVLFTSKFDNLSMLFGGISIHTFAHQIFSGTSKLPGLQSN